MPLENQKSILDIINEFECNDDWYVDFWLVAYGLLNQQSQYASCYADDLHKDYPNFWIWVRFIGNAWDYHSMLIHKDDIIKFVSKVLEYKNNNWALVSDEWLEILKQCKNYLDRILWSGNRTEVSKYQWLLDNFPEGLLGEQNSIPITIDGHELDLLVFCPEENNVSFGLFLHNQKYSRKSLIITNKWIIWEDDSWIIPSFDMTENEPIFNSSNSEIVLLVIEKLKSTFTNI